MNQTHTERPVYSDSQTNDSNESVLFSDSKKHTAQPVTSDSPMNDSKSQFFVVNQTHTAYPAYLKEASSF